MAELTYSAVGATRGIAPKGFRAIDRSALIGHGDDCFRSAVEQTMRWGLQRRSGMRVSAADRAVRVGDEARLRIPFWPRPIPCRVVYVVDDPHAAGFAYGTLRGHPESGEEAFLVERRPDGSVWTRIVAFSRPAGPLIRLGYPIARLLQEIYTRRYLRALAV